MMEEPPDGSNGPKFTPLVVLELASDTKEEAIAWLLSRIKDTQQHGGMEINQSHKALILKHVCAKDTQIDMCVWPQTPI